ncbi:hypothetical protein M5K25_023086 [Dendrobium thyrsiflorum]|uniref:MAGE domain-containing protein n=1 Tax=Dendrobium thyrsiflorum TaxID=117978 RepID=A0ABD0U785_DENTH
MASYEDLSQINVSKEEKDKLVAEVIRYVLFRTHHGNGCPIKREELTQLITKSYHQRSLPTLIINEAREKLAIIFGYEMKELQRTRASCNKRASQQSVADTKSYILKSKLPSGIYKKYVEDKGTSHISGFMFVVISIVHLAGGKIPEGENLWHHLRRMGFSESDENHPVFGNSKQTLELLVQQRFLQKEKTNGPEGNVFIYELAERALEGSIYEKLKDSIVEKLLIFCINEETMAAKKVDALEERLEGEMNQIKTTVEERMSSMEGQVADLRDMIKKMLEVHNQTTASVARNGEGRSTNSEIRKEEEEAEIIEGERRRPHLEPIQREERVYESIGIKDMLTSTQEPRPANPAQILYLRSLREFGVKLTARRN